MRRCAEKQYPRAFSSRATNRRVPHISLVFREMWETKALNRPVFGSTGREHKGSRIPHLAKNERDMGHPFVRGKERSPPAYFADLDP
jgi:hypothetical protein